MSPKTGNARRRRNGRKLKIKKTRGGAGGLFIIFSGWLVALIAIALRRTKCHRNLGEGKQKIPNAKINEKLDFITDGIIRTNNNNTKK